MPVLQKKKSSNDNVMKIELDFLPYDGIDPRLKAPFCFLCEASSGDSFYLYQKDATPTKKVSQCNRCKIAYYCSRDCQQKDWKHHKKVCNVIRMLRNDIEEKESQCREKNLFQDPTRVGWFHLYNWAYIKARFDLALCLHPTAFQTNIINIWKEINTHLQECLRLDHYNEGYDLGMRTKFAFFLLNVSRDDDVYSFVRYYAKRDGRRGESQFDFRAEDRIVEGSKEGDWVYPREPHCRYKDFLKEWRGVKVEDIQMCYLVAIWIIKIRIYSTLCNRERAMNCFKETIMGKKLIAANVGLVICSFLLGETEEQYLTLLLAQGAQAKRLADLIDQRNPTVLKALIDPEQLLSQDPPRQDELDRLEDMGLTERYNAAEAWLVVNDCVKATQFVPDLRAWLIHRYGEDSSYEYRFR